VSHNKLHGCVGYVSFVGLVGSKNRLTGLTVSTVLTLLLAVSANAATWYASAPDSSPAPSGTACSLAAPCTFSYALGTKGASGDTIVLLPGTYADTGKSLSYPVTITGQSSQLNTLTFQRGKVKSGVDNRPYFPGHTISKPGCPASGGGSGVFFPGGIFDIASTGVTVSYLRLRGATYPTDDNSGTDGVVSVSAHGGPVLIDHNEIWNGGYLVGIVTDLGVTVSNNDIHDTSVWAPWPFTCGSNQKSYGSPDTHAIVITNYNQDPPATSYAAGIQILNNSIYNAGGNGIQENSQCYARPGYPKTKYLTISGNDLSNVAKQTWDSKGTDNVIFSYNHSWFDHHTGNDVDYGHIAVNQPSDCSSVTMNNWEIFGNIFNGSNRYALEFNANGGGVCSNHHAYNNLAYDNNRSVAFADDPLWKLCPDANSTLYNNTFVNNNGSVRSGGIEPCSNGSNVKNNILMNNGADGNISSHVYNCNKSGTPDHNAVYGTSTGNDGTNTVTSCFLTGNCPGFVDLANNNYQLLTGSPEKDKGVTFAAPYNVDLLGVTRPQGSAFDIGAYEYTASTPPASGLVFNSTFNCQPWDGLSFHTNSSRPSCSDGRTQGGGGIGPHGDWSTANGNWDQITAAANYPGGGGGLGLLHWRGDGINNNGGGLGIAPFASGGASELWIRWYMKYPTGFALNPAGRWGHTKEVYMYGNSAVDWETGWRSSDAFGLEIYSPSHNTTANWGWQSTMGGLVGDGRWHCFEIHTKLSTQTGAAANGVTEWWIDGNQRISKTNEDYGSLGGVWNYFIFGSNGNEPSNGGVDQPVYYDDLAVSATGPIGCLTGTPSTSACDMNQDGLMNVSDVQLCANQAIAAIVCASGDINKDGACNVVDVQRVVNAALGGNCVTP
jgi:hypothetical protein